MKNMARRTVQIFQAIMPGIIAIALVARVDAEQLIKIDPNGPEESAEPWRKFVIEPESGGGGTNHVQTPFIRLEPSSIFSVQMKNWAANAPALGKDNLSMIVMLRINGAKGHIYFFDHNVRMGVMEESGALIPYLRFYGHEASGKDVNRYARPDKTFLMDTNTWVHFAALYDRAGNMSFFINGELVATTPIGEFENEDVYQEWKANYMPFAFLSVGADRISDADLVVDIAYAELRNDLLSSYQIKKDYEERLGKGKH